MQPLTQIDLIVELIGGAEGAAKKLVFNVLKIETCSYS